MRAILGDRTVPCAHALSATYDESLVQEAREEFPQGPAKRNVVQYWTDEAQAPGGPEDIILQLRVLPCQMVDVLQTFWLPLKLRSLAADQEGQECDLRLVGPQPEDDSEEDASWKEEVAPGI